MTLGSDWKKCQASWECHMGLWLRSEREAWVLWEHQWKPKESENKEEENGLKRSGREKNYVTECSWKEK